MHYVVIIFLLLFFAYALGLVILNNNEIAVNLLFTHAPEMNLGLLFIVCILLGILIGILLALLLFKVFQNKWELIRLRKENSKLTHKLDKAAAEIALLKEPIVVGDNAFDKPEVMSIKDPSDI